MTPFQPSVRLKLTLLYGALFLIAGLFLISVTYGLVRRELAPNAQRPIGRVVQDRPGNHQDSPDDRVAGARREERRFALRQAVAAIGIRPRDRDRRRAWARLALRGAGAPSDSADYGPCPILIGSDPR